MCELLEPSGLRLVDLRRKAGFDESFLVCFLRYNLHDNLSNRVSLVSYASVTADSRQDSAMVALNRTRFDISSLTPNPR
jgi:hypothetical protein